jgi:hypothetical protein
LTKLLALIQKLEGETHLWLKSIRVFVVGPQDTVVAKRDLVLGDPMVLGRVTLALSHNAGYERWVADVKLEPLIICFLN